MIVPGPELPRGLPLPTLGADTPPSATKPFAPDADLLAALAVAASPGAAIDAPLGSGPAPRAASPRASARLAALAAGEALVVATGQQPTFPLPLGLTLQKAATAVALAARLEAAWGRPVVPLFWSAADDSDFAEAAGQLLPRPAGPAMRVTLPEALSRKGAFVGDLPLEAAWEALLALGGVASGLEALGPVAGEDLGTHTRRLLAERFAPWGMLVLDAREPALRRAAAPLFARYAERREAFAAAIDAGGERLVAGGLREAPLRCGLGERALFFLKGRRRVLPPGGDYGPALAERLAADPEGLSPNASLRPLVQDFALPVAAAVLGPSEWEYHAQLAGAFAVLDLPFPPALPRLRVAADPEAGPRTDLERAGSPLALPGDARGDAAALVAAAGKHLDRWAAGGHTLFLHREGNP